MGLSDFSPHTQDLLAVEILRSAGLLDKIVAGDIDLVLPKASYTWAALPQGPNKPGRYDQPYMKYSDFIAKYESLGGIKK
jgi:muramidase (phage lysozyme)